ncbi:MAG: prenyltransferase/squalene oxidase repeat-containing protein [Zavarzinella sp.]
MVRIVIIGMICLLVSSGAVSADDKFEHPKIEKKTQEAVDKALEWLAKRQNSDGSWSEPSYPNNTAITGYALMAFMSQGHVPNKGKYGPEVSKGIRFLVASSRDGDGYLVGARGGNMYCHGMATLALSQAWGMSGSNKGGDEDLKKVLKKAVDLIVRSQSSNGGWRYSPSPSGADISVTIMQVMALRGAKDSGLHVPDKTLDKALEYIDSCYDSRSGGYLYMPQSGSAGFARTAAGICVLKLCGQYEKNIGKSVTYLKQNMKDPREHFWYGHYYACHAMHQVGGKDWQDYYATITDKFLKMQQSDGHWSKSEPHSAGTVYQTAIAVIALSVPAEYLPIFQR